MAVWKQSVARKQTARSTVLAGSRNGPSQIDGHQHIHVFPGGDRAGPGSCETATGSDGCGFPMRRFPAMIPFPATCSRKPGCFGALGKAARGRLEGSGLRATDHFRGLLLKGRLSVETLLAAIEQLPDGLTELMVHPGRVAAGSAAGPFASFSTADREREIEALLDPSVRRALKRSGVLLTSYREVDR